MKEKGIYDHLKAARKQGRKLFSVLIDPGPFSLQSLDQVLEAGQAAGVDLWLVGGSLLVDDKLGVCLERIKQQTDVPVLLFPGSHFQIHEQADAILFLSLISGRNPELLIGQQVVAAPYLRQSHLEVISTGYMLVDGGVPTTVSYMSNTLPIPADKPEIAVSTALAGEMLGLKLLFMDAGSGARQAIQPEMIEAVRHATSIPLLIGGGIRTPDMAAVRARAGADLIVVGNAIEKAPLLIQELAAAVHEVGNTSSSTPS